MNTPTPDWQKIIKHPDRRDPPAVLTEAVWNRIHKVKS